MADNMEKLLERYRNDIVSHVDDSATEVRREIGGIREQVTDLRREMMSHFDAMYARFDKLESEY